MSVVVADHVSRRFGDVAAIADASFAVERGQIVALLGPNGAGKTTLLEVLEGFAPPSAGSVSVLGADPVHGSRAWRARIGVVPQSTSLDEQLTVREALDVFVPLYPRAYPVAEVLSMLELDTQADTLIGRLSRGQQRRVDLALGIVGRPDVLFLDEPTTGLDPDARRRIWAIVERLTGDGTTVLLSTHGMDEAERLADRLLVLAHGRLVADTTPATMRESAAPSLVRLPHRPEIRTADVNDTLVRLIAEGADLSGLQVGPPSLEEAYVALTNGHG